MEELVFEATMAGIAVIQGLHGTRYNNDIHFQGYNIQSDPRIGGSNQKMTKCDMGEGVKNPIFGVTYFLHGPLRLRNYALYVDSHA